LTRTERIKEGGRGAIRRAGAQLRRFFVTGILVLAPLVVTFWVLYSLYNALESRFGKLFAGWESQLPGLGFLAGLILIVGVGWFASNYIGKRLLSFWDRFIHRIPVVSRIYRAAQQVGEAVLGQNRTLFQEVVLIEYPRKGVYCVAFRTNENGGEIEEKTARDLISVFLPTTPNPTSGFLLFVPTSDVIRLSMTVEEAMKLIISAGAVLPPEYHGKHVQLPLPVEVEPVGTESPIA